MLPSVLGTSSGPSKGISFSLCTGPAQTPLGPRDKVESWSRRCFSFNVDSWRCMHMPKARRVCPVQRPEPHPAHQSRRRNTTYRVASRPHRSQVPWPTALQGEDGGDRRETRAPQHSHVGLLFDMSEGSATRLGLSRRLANVRPSPPAVF
ncbi:hypothetical protein GQ53DRAFT_325196 [Thozetella sp. PMI_491]|nr:hypothetical protein GQ53DRAFT_325196 [Thozetella sp. PMI_491]